MINKMYFMKYFLLVLISFVAATSIIVGLLLMSIPDGTALSFSLGLLKKTNFHDFQIPGFLMVLFVGLPNVLALFYVTQNTPQKNNFAIVAGLILLIWILIQYYFVSELFWVNTLYMTIAVSIILTAFQLKGKSMI